VADVRAAVTQAVAMATEASVAMGRAAAELEAVALREDEAAAELREEKALLEAQVARLEELRVSAAAAQRDMKAAAALETAALEAAAAAATTAAEEAATPQAAAGVLSSMRLSNSRVRAAATDEGVEGGGSGSGSRDDGSDGGDGSSGGGGGSGSGDSGGDDMSSGRRQRRPVYRGVARPSCALSGVSLPGLPAPEDLPMHGRQDGASRPRSAAGRVSDIPRGSAPPSLRTVSEASRRRVTDVWASSLVRGGRLRAAARPLSGCFEPPRRFVEGVECGALLEL